MEKADVDRFAGRVASMRERVSRLFRSAQAGATPELLMSAFDELQSALEELQLAEETVRVQSQEQATALSALETEHRSYCDLFEQAPVGYLVTSAEGTIRQANQPASVLLGTQARQLIGRSLALFVPEGSRRAFRTHIPRLCQSEGPHEWRVRLQPWEGEPFEALLLVSTTYDSAGRPAALRWLAHRLAERSRRREERASTVSAYEQQVEILTAQLAELRAQIHALAQYASEVPLRERELGSASLTDDY
ncbi:MAG TPA: PAS domain-containing protein [Roseiflexaceae bacterium]|nr:PAS domain-containing protein [Roseiflexaceae bacterium]